MNRKLASIQRIIDLKPIENADKIEVAQVLGWHCVVKKGEFKVGDLGVYFEIDSVLPERPEFDFLKEKHFRIRTVKLRGQVSQGLLMPLNSLPQLQADRLNYAEGMDVTELLGVKKYEPVVPAHLSGVMKGQFPLFLRKTDEMRIQSIPEFLIRHKGKLFYITEKLDGTSFTVYMKDGEFGVCSRNIDLLESDNNLYWQVAKKFNFREKLLSLGNFAIQGEICGPGVQKNKYSLTEPRLFTFSIFNISEYKYLDFENFKQICKDLGIETVPILDENFTLDCTVEELVELSKGRSFIFNNIEREGLVIRSKVEGDDLEAGRISFKVVNPDFLLKYE
jgi:RNA ligase (TIGR02306 family)